MLTGRKQIADVIDERVVAMVDVATTRRAPISILEFAESKKNEVKQWDLFVSTPAEDCTVGGAAEKLDAG